MKIGAVFFDLDDMLIAYESISEFLWDRIIGDYCKAQSLVSKEILINAISAKSNWYWGDLQRHTKGRKFFA